MSDSKSYLIFLDPPTTPGSAIQRAHCDLVRKLGASLDTSGSALEGSSEPSDVQAIQPLRPRHDDHLPDLSSVRISDAAAPRPRIDPLRVSTARIYDSRARTPSGGSDSASDAASPTNTDGVGSTYGASDPETSPVGTDAASHRLFHMPMYMPLPNIGTSTSARSAVPGPDVPGNKLSMIRSTRPSEAFASQVFTILMKIGQEIPHNMSKFLSAAHQPPFRMLFDPGYCSIWAIGSHCQKMEIPPGLPLMVPLNPQYYRGYYEQNYGGAHSQIYMHHHCPDGSSESAVPATVQLPNVRYGCTKFVNTSAAVVALTSEKHYLEFVNCVQWDKSSWDAPLTIPSRIGVAHCLTQHLYVDHRLDGIIGFAPSDSQNIFNLMNPLDAPSVLASLQSTPQLAQVDDSDGGIVVYCAMRPFALWDKSQMKLRINPYRSWIAFNRWPIQFPEQPEMSTPRWSEKIKIFQRDGDRPTWNILLLSMKFIRFHQNVGPNGTWLPVPNGEIVFDGPGLVTLLDPGCSASWVPPKVVRCVRTALFPCAYNQDLDRRLGDHAAMTWTTNMTGRSPSEFNYTVEPAQVDHNLCAVEYRFSSITPAGSTVVEVTGPVDQFICSLNPAPTPMGTQKMPENEGALFVAPPGSLGHCSNSFGAIFGVNFFQSMLVAFGKPGVPKRRPYVRLAPQWGSEIKNFGPPPHIDDDY